MASSYFLNAIRRRWYLPETTVEISDPGRVAHGDVSASAAELPRREVAGDSREASSGAQGALWRSSPARMTASRLPNRGSTTREKRLG